MIVTPKVKKFMARHCANEYKKARAAQQIRYRAVQQIQVEMEMEKPDGPTQYEYYIATMDLAAHDNLVTFWYKQQNEHPI